MTINRIGYLEPIQPGKQPGRGDPVQKTKSDSITLSSEAVEKSELYHAMRAASSAPDIRLERIEELRQKINDPSYINEKIINATADKIMDALGL
jgi:negative regulator of flagellin synthesis FlgM